MKELVFFKSTRKGKKYDVYEETDKGLKYLVSFGSKNYQHYFDKLGKYSHLNHNDDKRRKAYYKRHKVNHPKYSADYFSKKLLW